MKKKHNIITFYLLFFVYLEFVNKILMFNKLPGIEFLIVILFSLSISFLLSLITKLSKEQTNKIICSTIVIIITSFYLFNYLYYSLFNTPFSINDLELMGNALGFYKIALHLINIEFINILIFCLPVILFILTRRDFDYLKNSGKNKIWTFFLFALVHMLSLLALNYDKTTLYSPYNLYYNIDSLSNSTEVLGLLTSWRLNIKRSIFGFKEKIILEEKEQVSTSVEYNILDIDFSSLINKESDESIKNIYKYIENKTPTNKNEYTGIYEGKNLIFILAEGFNSIAVDESRTPTLYKLIHEGFDFTNYYSPVFLSTTGGEFQAMTGLIPTQEILNLWRNTNPTLSYAIGNAFNDIGYNTYSFHNWSYSYYSRDNTMPTLGFNNYKGCGNGLENLIDCSWVPSDIDLINASFNAYASNMPFVSYYVTVSGHAPYNFTGGNKISIKNKDTVNDLPYSDSVKAYLASQMELEYALDTLISRLEESGILDDTVIVLTGDHYPYTLTVDEINEISEYQRDEIVEVNHSNLIIWNTSNEHVVIDKVASQIDVLPTILNLFGIEYDSRLLVGKDIFSDEEGLAIFSNRNWISDKGVFTNMGFLTENDVSDDYISYMNSRIANSFTFSKLMLEKDIYKKIENYMEGEN